MYFPHTYQTPVVIGNDGQQGKMGTKEMPLSLFDLDKDIGETTNLASQHPDIIARLSNIAKDFDAELKKTMRPPGQVM